MKFKKFDKIVLVVGILFCSFAAASSMKSKSAEPTHQVDIVSKFLNPNINRDDLRNIKSMEVVLKSNEDLPALDALIAEILQGNFPNVQNFKLRFEEGFHLEASRFTNLLRVLLKAYPDLQILDFDADIGDQGVTDVLELIKRGSFAKLQGLHIRNTDISKRVDDLVKLAKNHKNLRSFGVLANENTAHTLDQVLSIEDIRSVTIAGNFSSNDVKRLADIGLMMVTGRDNTLNYFCAIPNGGNDAVKTLISQVLKALENRNFEMESSDFDVEIPSRTFCFGPGAWFTIGNDPYVSYMVVTQTGLIEPEYNKLED